MDMIYNTLIIGFTIQQWGGHYIYISASMPGGLAVCHLIGRVGVGPAVEQQAHHLEEAEVGGHEEARPAVLQKGRGIWCLLWRDKKKKLLIFLYNLPKDRHLNIIISFIFRLFIFYFMPV